MESGHLPLQVALVSLNQFKMGLRNASEVFLQLVLWEHTRTTQGLICLVCPALQILTPHLLEAQAKISAFVILVSRRVPMEPVRVSDKLILITTLTS